jgi:hypothetical protein
MNVITLILVLMVVGLCLWLVLKYWPMPDVVKRIIVAIVVLAFVLWVLDATGLYQQRWFRW